MRIVLAAALAISVFSIASAATSEPRVVAGFTLEKIASIAEARELAIAPNGDLFVGTSGNDVYIVPHAEATAGSSSVFAHFNDSPAAGVALSNDALFVGTQFGVYRIAYKTGETRAATAPERLASVRTSGTSRDHSTTSVAWNGTTLYASIGSSCNGCDPELDATRATIQEVDLAHHAINPVATHIRNAIALAVNPQSHALWAGVAGIDDLPPGHPYEIFDDVSAHAQPIDYGWPGCYENHKVHPRWPRDCSHAAVPRVVLPAYDTPIGAVFYPTNGHGRYEFPGQYRGGAFVTLHGSWHDFNGLVPPRVAFVPIRGDEPLHAVNWNDPNTQWSEFIRGYQEAGSNERIGRPTGIVVGPEGSLFVADDLAGAVYRIRPK